VNPKNRVRESGGSTLGNAYANIGVIMGILSLVVTLYLYLYPLQCCRRMTFPLLPPFSLSPSLSLHQMSSINKTNIDDKHKSYRINIQSKLVKIVANIVYFFSFFIIMGRSTLRHGVAVATLDYFPFFSIYLT